MKDLVLTEYPASREENTNIQSFRRSQCPTAKMLFGSKRKPWWDLLARVFSHLVGLLLLAGSLSGLQAATSLQITTKTLPSAVVGTPYALTLAATGGTPPYKWALISGG